MLGKWFRRGNRSASSAAENEPETKVKPGQIRQTPKLFKDPPQGPAEVTPLIAADEEGIFGEDGDALSEGPSDPDDAPALLEAAQKARLEGEVSDAERLYGKLLASEPRNADALHGLGLLALEGGDLAKAENLICASMRLDPLQAAYHRNFGRLLRQKGETEAAVHAFDEAARLRPDSASLQNDRGEALRDAGRIKRAEAAFRLALALDKGFAAAHWNLACLHLLRGNHAEGWPGFRWGFEARTRRSAAPPLPEYDGSKQPEATVVLWGDGDLGSQIMCAQLLPDLRQRVADVVVVTETHFAGLLAQAYPGILCFSPLDPLDLRKRYPGATHHLPMGDLPRLLCPEPKNLGYRPPYLTAEPQTTAALRQRYGGDSGGKRLVGIAWRGTENSGGGDTGGGGSRALPLDLWAGVLGREDLRFVSLEGDGAQEDIAAVQNGLGVEIFHDRWIDRNKSLDDFAAQLSALDLVITLDGLTPHLAGALSIKTKLLLPNVPHWAWGLEGRQTPWYHSLELFRQPRPGDWRGALAELAGSL